jgi:hypothetical protein
VSDQAWDKALEQVAREIVYDIPGWRGRSPEFMVAMVRREKEVLQRELGPLLEAGQAMRDAAHAGLTDDDHEELFIDWHPVVAWDDAKAKLTK